jgi:t-SNARE complex subunit (syntaxin)
LKLTQRLKSSERSLASMARDNEDRIVELQNRVDDMNLEVVKQRREIQEYKGKEKNSLDQISAVSCGLLRCFPFFLIILIIARITYIKYSTL